MGNIESQQGQIIYQPNNNQLSSRNQNYKIAQDNTKIESIFDHVIGQNFHTLNELKLLIENTSTKQKEIKTQNIQIPQKPEVNQNQKVQQIIIERIQFQQVKVDKPLLQAKNVVKPIQYAFGKFISQHPQMPPLIRQIYSTVQNTNTDQKFVSRRYANIRQPFYHNVLKGVYVGEWTEDSITGYGKYFYDDGSYFQGYVIDGYANNKNGLLIFPNGNYYKGSFVNSQINGHGLLSIKNTLIYNGEFSHELPHGEGTQTSNRGDVYQGQFKQGQKQGYGSYKDYQGYFYKGNFKRSKFDGIGTLYYPNGDKYSGSFKNGVKNGKGKFQFFDKGIIQGYFQNDIPHGQIQCVDKNGVIYKGQFRNGKINGQCQIILNKEIYQSYWDLGVKIQIAKQQLKNLN